MSPMNNRIYPCNATPQLPHGFVFAHRWFLVLVTLFVLSVNELHVLAVSPSMLAWIIHEHCSLTKLTAFG